MEIPVKIEIMGRKLKILFNKWRIFIKRRGLKHRRKVKVAARKLKESYTKKLDEKRDLNIPNIFEEFLSFAFSKKVATFEKHKGSITPRLPIKNVRVMF